MTTQPDPAGTLAPLTCSRGPMPDEARQVLERLSSEEDQREWPSVYWDQVIDAGGI